MWFLLNFVPRPGFRRGSLPALVGAFSAAKGEPLKLFAPTFTAISPDGLAVKQRPLLYHYIFMRGNEATVKDFCLQNEGFSFVLDRSGEKSRRVTVTDDTLEQFRLIARFHAGQLPCFSLKDISLEEGDKVRIVDGDFAGLTGTYMSRKGGKSGNVLIALDSSLAAIVCDIKAEYVSVLEFARDSRRVYDQLDAFADRLRPLLNSPTHIIHNPSSILHKGSPSSNSEPTHTYSIIHTPSSITKVSEGRKANHREAIPLNYILHNPYSIIHNTSSILHSASVFTRRLGETKLHNPKLDAKLQILLYAAYRILSDTEGGARALEKYRSLEHHVTNPKTRALASSILQI